MEIFVLVCLYKTLLLWMLIFLQAVWCTGEVISVHFFCFHFRIYVVFLNLWIHIQKIHLGKGRMAFIQMPHLLPMELSLLWCISSMKGMYSVPFAPTNSAATWCRMHLAAVACIHFMSKSSALASILMWMIMHIMAS